ncbi:sugar transferase [Bacillus pacificus]|uniref:sugar transferase n=1 Tax=Bacillus TaxID=1386 RepID=UPI00034A010E|nr:MULTISPECIES: sugar transferase [Bacillus cereus group]MCC2416554.1 sugar transferase [Bacillus pacificus]MCU5007376.1 sugar transferase [Bacillus pacificus]MCU5256452.1 sugar transferase [Bacillus pacificus]MCU5562671.1 sugar transferase [Bacillus pacificus]MDK7490042.1 sugar transferase [Bacillus paranthracis]
MKVKQEVVTQDNQRISLGDSNNKKGYLFIKRVLDVVLSSIGLIVVAPLILIVGILIKIESRGNIFYLQERVGLYGKEFKVIKLRSMRQDAERKGAQWATINDPRITRVGSFIRKTRIDELPQLINIFKGEMSFIGPRPEREVFVREFEKKISGFSNRVEVKPGLTGLAQVKGGYDLSPKEKWELDMEYIKIQGFKIDAYIILKTIRVVITGEGAR